MILYSGPLSMYGAKAQIAFLEKGIPVETQMVPFNLKDLYLPKHPEVARINPKAQVPVLKDGDLEIFDSTQIFEYLEDISSQVPLWPSAPVARAQARLLELQSDEVFFGHVQKLMPGQRALADAEPVSDVVARIESYYDAMNQRLATGDYLVGDFSYADIAFYPAQFFSGFLGAPVPDRFDLLHAWRDRMAARSSIATVMGAIAAYLTEQGIPASL